MRTLRTSRFPRLGALRAVTPVLLAGLVLTACGDDGSADGTNSGTDTDTATETETDPSATMTASATLSTTVDTVDPDSSTDPTQTATETDPDTSGSSSTGEPVVCELQPGAVWDAPDWDANAAVALALRAQLDTLVGAAVMTGHEAGAVPLTGLSDLTDVWDGTVSLADAASPAFAMLVADAFQEFVDLIGAGNQELLTDGSWDPGEHGGIWGPMFRGINEGGLEIRQFVDKGAFGAGVMFEWAVAQTAGDIDPATIDAIAAAWGTNATLEPGSSPTNTDAANYSYQMGFHAEMAAALADAKAFSADEACGAERDAALVTFFNLWEQSMFARAVFYGNRGAGTLLTADDSGEYASVLHDLGEGVGVVIGFYGITTPDTGPLAGGARIVTDDQVLEAIGAYGVDYDALGASTTGVLLESLPNFEAANAAFEAVVMDVYDVDAGTIQTYRMPTPG